MNPRVTLAVAGRVLTQVRRDRRTVAMLLVVPCVLISLLWWMFSEMPGDLFDRFGPGLLSIFPFIVMFVVTSVTTLRERSSGTLERLLSMPLGKFDFLLGYAIAFALIAAVQALLAVGVSVWILGLDVAGSVWLLGLVAVLAGAVCQRLCVHRIPGGAVHAAVRLAAGPALRAVRAAVLDALGAGGDQRRPTPFVCRRRDAGVGHGSRYR